MNRGRIIVFLTRTARNKKILFAILAILLLVGVVVPTSYKARAVQTLGIPPLSEIALHSHFADVNDLGFVSPSIDVQQDQQQVGVRGSQLNKDFNQRPQNEPSITVNPTTGQEVVGANDYGIGVPIGGGVYSHVQGAPVPVDTYFPPFPLLCGRLVSADGCPPGSVIEPPVGTGDAALVYSARYNEYYYTSLGFSAVNCENGVFLFRSSNGVDWTRPVAPPFAPPNGLRTVVYWDKSSDCSVFNDKEYVIVDNNPASSFYGRIYVSWTQFKFDPLAIVYMKSPIELAYSDNRGNTFSSPIEVSGSSATFCMHPFNPANTGTCNENQFSVPVVGSDGSVYIAFENQENDPVLLEFRNQYLVATYNPATNMASTSPHQAVGTIYDGANDYPTQTTGGQGRQTLCNSNFRVISAGNMAIRHDGDNNPANDVLYVTWSDDRAKAGMFPGVTVGPRSSGYACPTGLSTDTDVFAVKSSNGGASWTGPIKVNQDKPSVLPANNIDQWFPWVAVNDANGQVTFLYHDRRYDTSPVPNKLARTTISTTSDLASYKEVDAAGFASNFDNAFFGTGSFIGDYINVTVVNGHQYAVFTGVTPGKNDSDIFFFFTG